MKFVIKTQEPKWAGQDGDEIDREWHAVVDDDNEIVAVFWREEDAKELAADKCDPEASSVIRLELVP